MRVAKLLILVVVAGLLAGLGAACEPTEEKEPSASEWIAKGKTLLGEGNGNGAYTAFQEALKQEKHNLQAQYGVVLADVLQFTATIDLLATQLTEPPTDISADDTAELCQKLDTCGVLDTVDQDYNECVASATFGLDDATVDCVLDAPDCDVMNERCGLTLPPSAELCSAACTKMDDCGLLTSEAWNLAECLANCPTFYQAGSLQCLLELDECTDAAAACFPSIGPSLQEFIADFWEDINEEMAESLANVQAQPEDFSFEIKKYEISLLDLPLQPSLSGRHDYSDTFFFVSAYSAMDALFSSVLGVDLNFNPQVLPLFLTLPELSFDFDDFGPEDIASLVELLQWVDGVIDAFLSDPVYTSFLTTNEEDGVATLQHVGQQIGNMFGALAVMIEQVKAQGADPDSPIHFLDENGDGQWNAPEPLIIPGVAQWEYDLAWAIHDLLLALKIDFVDGYPFHFESLEPLFAYFDLAWVNTLIAGLDLVGVDSIDLGETFREPTPEGLRPLLAGAQEVIEQLIVLLTATP